VDLKTLEHGVDIPVVFNGNYGSMRVILIPKAPCKVVWDDLEIKGPYEEDLQDREDTRFQDIEDRRDDNILQTLSNLQGTLHTGPVGKCRRRHPCFWGPDRNRAVAIRSVNRRQKE